MGYLFEKLAGLNMPIKKARLVSKITDKLQAFAKFLYLYLAFVGIFGFSCFIMEESIQLISFANFSASDNRNYAAMKYNLDLAERINNTKRTIAMWTLWLIPPQRLAYIAYADSVDAYIATLRAEILANEPELFMGEEITLAGFRYLSIEKLSTGLYRAKNRDMSVILTRSPQTKTVNISGVMQRDQSGNIFIENR